MDFKLALLVFSGATAVSAVVLVAVYRILQAKAATAVSDPEAAATDPARRFVSPTRFAMVRFCMMSGFAVMAICILAVKDVCSAWAFLVGALLTGFIGWKLPVWWLARKLRQRKEIFDSQILALTMNLANGLRSGQALPQALDAVAKRMMPPMQEELAIVLREVRLGLDLPEALERLHARMPGEDLRLLVTTVRLTLQTGGSLAEVLGRMTEMIRSRTEFQEKVKTMTAQGRFEAVVMSLAPVFVYVLLRLIDPELMKPLTSTPIGICAIVSVAVMITVGYFVIRKIVSIEV